MAYLVKDGQYAQVELNQVAFPRDGRIEAQCALSDEFSENKPAENGMILVVDNEDRVIRFPAEGKDKDERSFLKSGSINSKAFKILVCSSILSQFIC